MDPSMVVARMDPLPIDGWGKDGPIIGYANDEPISGCENDNDLPPIVVVGTRRPVFEMKFKTPPKSTGPSMVKVMTPLV